MTDLPNAHRAVIDNAKISDYLLSHTHPRGSAKAAFFERFGFALDRPEEFRLALLQHARHRPVLSSELTKFGEAFETRGPIQSPDGRLPTIRVIWMIRIGEDFPRLVTAIPSEATLT